MVIAQLLRRYQRSAVADVRSPMRRSLLSNQVRPPQSRGGINIDGVARAQKPRKRSCSLTRRVRVRSPRTASAMFSARLDRIRRRKTSLNSLNEPAKTVSHAVAYSRTPTHSPRPRAVDYNTFLQILHRPDGFESAGTAGASPHVGTTALLIVSDGVQRSSSRDSKYSTGRETASSDKGNCVTFSPPSGRSSATQKSTSYSRVSRSRGQPFVSARADRPLTCFRRSDGNINYVAFVHSLLGQ